MSQRSLIWLGILLALGAHTGRGVFPVLARYLQVVRGLPTFSFMALVSIPLVFILIVQLADGKSAKQLLTRAMWLLALMAIMRTATGNLAARFTIASFVQLFTLMTPFIVVLLNGLFFKEKLPKFTVWAITLCSVGAVLMLSKDLTQSGLSFQFSSSDILGIGFAIASAVFTALYLLTVRNAVKYSELPPALILNFQVTAIFLATTITSIFLREPLEPWMNLSLVDWGVVFLYFLIVVFGSNALLILALKYVSAPVVSSMMAWRLVVTVAIAFLVLGERLESVSQILGALLVVATVTWYLWQQREI